MSLAPSPEPHALQAGASFWLHGPFVHWWLLPSLHMDDSWRPHVLADYVPVDGPPQLLAHLHQHWSAQVLAQDNPSSEALRACAQHPAVPLLIAPAPQRAAWLLHAGLCISAPQLRRCIDRASRESVVEALGAEALEWAVRHAPRWQAASAAPLPLHAAPLGLAESVRFRGMQLLQRALAQAPQCLQQRLCWMFPHAWGRVQAPFDSVMSPAQAVTLCHDLMLSLEPAWPFSSHQTH